MAALASSFTLAGMVNVHEQLYTFGHIIFQFSTELSDGKLA